ncbi:hypothetical protein HPB50_003285 [Hyalomma asiaticum]|uniref:Uncharacterized protein n=1 Tax=Hyalomma asiaticum TaxID=266040 RepID=A0ACB7TBF0_HYAAI|nr:hypothetical protein HPB50_003285 [Hyalomma asiaticum]
MFALGAAEAHVVSLNSPALFYRSEGFGALLNSVGWGVAEKTGVNMTTGLLLIKPLPWIAIYGKSFCTSAKEAFKLLMRNVVRVVVLDKVTDLLLLVGKLVIVGIVAVPTFLVFSRKVDTLNNHLPELNYYMLPILKKLVTAEEDHEVINSAHIALKVGWASSCDNGTAVHCKYCNCNIRPHYSDLLKHAETKKHRESAVIPSTQRELPQLLASSRQANYEKARRELRIALYIAVHTSINAVDELGEILHSEFKVFDLHRTKCTAIITNVLFPYFTESMDKQLKGSSYSLMVDESTDISTTKQLCIVVRFLNSAENKIATTLLDLVELSDGTAQTLHDTVMKTLDKHGLPVKDCLGLCTDGANSMSGNHNSLFSRLREDNKELVLSYIA